MPLRRSVLLSAVLLMPMSMWAQQPAAGNAGTIGDVLSADATVRGSVVVGSKGTSLMSGSQVGAGESNATVKLRRGGELQVCRGSNITVTSSSNGREMLIAVNAGAIETHYALPSTSDTVMTPDFRLTLTGPGEFQFAIGSSGNGGMCVRSLRGNTSSIIVNEQFGEGAHQVKPGEQITFRNGHVDDFAPEAGDCGCPQAPVVERPAATPAPPTTGLAFPEQQSRNAEQAVSAGLEPKSEGPPVTAPAKPGETVTQVDAPMVVRAEDLPPPQPSVASNRLPAWPISQSLLPKAEAPAKTEKKPWYKRFGGALASIFGGGNPQRKSQ